MRAAILVSLIVVASCGVSSRDELCLVEAECMNVDPEVWCSDEGRDACLLVGRRFQHGSGPFHCVERYCEAEQEAADKCALENGSCDDSGDSPIWAAPECEDEAAALKECAEQVETNELT